MLEQKQEYMLAGKERVMWMLRTNSSGHLRLVAKRYGQRAMACQR